MTTLPHARPTTGVTWARVEDGFHVGSRAGEFVGYIDRRADGEGGGFVAFDLFSRRVGSFPDLPSAMAALTADVSDAPGVTTARRPD